MWRYLRAAFWAGPPVPLLGKLPFNLLFVLSTATLGFFEPSIWLAAAGLEIIYLFALASNRRFQKVIDAIDRYESSDDTEARKQNLIAQLDKPARERLAQLQSKISRALDLATQVGTESFTIDANRDALRKLEWLYLKLLLAQHFLLTTDTQSTTATILTQIASLRSEIARRDTLDTVRESKQATLDLLEKRLAALERRKQTLLEIDSDLTRIDAQTDLALETASLKGESHRVTTNINLVSQLLDTDLYGSSSHTIAQLDQSFSTPTKSPT